jgi:hypothetical protein
VSSKNARTYGKSETATKNAQIYFLSDNAAQSFASKVTGYIVRIYFNFYIKVHFSYIGRP